MGAEKPRWLAPWDFDQYAPFSVGINFKEHIRRSQAVESVIEIRLAYRKLVHFVAMRAADLARGLPGGPQILEICPNAGDKGLVGLWAYDNEHRKRGVSRSLLVAELAAFFLCASGST